MSKKLKIHRFLVTVTDDCNPEPIMAREIAALLRDMDTRNAGLVVRSVTSLAPRKKRAL